MIKTLALASSFLLAGCASNPPSVRFKGVDVQVELARTADEQARGLMFRESLADDRGMLFLFKDEAPRAFWMKNCKIPLDILYFNAQFKLVGHALGAPPCAAGDACPSYPSGAPAKYVLELRGGWVEDRGGVQLGEDLKFDEGKR
jgi:hypothetical protein